VDPPPRFYFGAMSPYSWFAAERIEQLLPAAEWRGVLAGAVFKAHGRVSWGLTDQRADGIADCEARAAAHGLGPIRWPEPWPTSDLLLARAMAYADRCPPQPSQSQARLKAFALSAMRLAFLEGADLGAEEAVLEAGRRTGIDPGDLRDALSDADIKGAVRKVTYEALALGVFGVPTIAIGAELFWGDDRVKDAVAAYRSLSHA
jgi:2-hydroxychromene-2-carboxylate isomerase